MSNTLDIERRKDTDPKALREFIQRGMTAQTISYDEAITADFVGRVKALLEMMRREFITPGDCIARVVTLDNTAAEAIRIIADYHSQDERSLAA